MILASPFKHAYILMLPVFERLFFKDVLLWTRYIFIYEYTLMSLAMFFIDHSGVNFDIYLFFSAVLLFHAFGQRHGH